MREDLKYTLMVTGMVVSWSVYYAVSKILVDATGSPLRFRFEGKTGACPNAKPIPLFPGMVLELKNTKLTIK